MNAGKAFFWGAITLAALTFGAALIAGASLADRFRGADDDQSRYDELLEEALGRLDKGDLIGSKRITERLLARDPKDPYARSNLGRIYKSEGDYPRAIAEMKLALTGAPDVPDLYYDVACYYALLKRKEEAITWLARAFTHGFGRRELLLSDADLASLKGDGRFQTLARAGKLADGVPHILSVDAVREVRKGRSFELTVVVERDLLPGEAAKPLLVEWRPDPPLSVEEGPLSETRAIARDGIVEVKTTVRWAVRAPREGVFALPPVEVQAGEKNAESDSLEVRVIGAKGPDPSDEQDDPGESP